ncbi:hypothetical protein ACPXCE_26680 [Streptomyces sp. DT24]|uniref:hypothetical protein n=1 Tax=unclassified Streptomyces TaxID=2593676 RepID=UPI0023B8C723|nr:hypothetical protein [Streptomyces sp. AM 4-1-1]WEH34178.1 hypothetical protein PZB75_12885 [Streptomyces sp. AM 4-1-1]
MSHDHDPDHEPVLKRSKWGTNRYVYNHRNPVGMALIVITPVIAIGVLLILFNSGPR